MRTVFKDPLFHPDGQLSVQRFTPAGREIVELLQRRLTRLCRQMFLPLDLVVVLLERGHDEVADIIAHNTEGVVDPGDVANRLDVLAEEIDDDDSDAESDSATPSLVRHNFSRGLTRIFEEALAQARCRGDDQIGELDLVRCVVWRAEAVESASIRWAIRRLREGKGDSLFDKQGLLKLQGFDTTAKGMLKGAMKLACSHGTSFLGTPHLIAMMASVRDSVIWRSARSRGLEPNRLRKELIRLIGSKPESIPEFRIGRKTLTPRMIRLLQQSVKDADDEPVGEPQLVEAFLNDGGSSLELLRALGLESEIRNALGEPRVLANSPPVEAAIEFASERRASPTLDMLGRDLTEEALQGQLPPIVGRRRELTRVFNVLMRREQRNPLLIGEAGVGKTALAIGLAQHIASGWGPDKLRGHRVIEINGASLMSGTSYRGDLEARIESLLEEASRNVILFIDEAHAVFSPRSGSNAPAEVPNHFKRALASGKIAVIGATTEDEYRRWFEQDPALKRRFESIRIDEPCRELTRKILGSLTEELQQEYEVQIQEEALEYAIELSVRFLPEQRLPDKAKKVLMDACIACANPLAEPEQQQQQGQPGEEDGEDESDPVVDRRSIARQIQLKTAIPRERLLRGETAWWKGLKKRLCDAIVGQHEAMEEIAQILVSSRIKNADRQRPLAVLAFVGPSGVGKATAAGMLAEEIFYDHKALIRLDMTDFQQAHALSRLIGSPPGYVGYEDADMLVTPLRKRPSSVVLLEDFDRAHPDIQDRLLRLIEEGEVTDTQGRSADATNAIFVLTISTESASSARPIGFGGDDDSRRQLLHQRLGDGVLASRLNERIDGAVAFGDLSGDGSGGAVALCDLMLQRLVDNMCDEYGVELDVTDPVIDWLHDAVGELATGRQVEQIIDETIVAAVSRHLLEGESVDKIEVQLDDGQISVVASGHKV